MNLKIAAAGSMAALLFLAGCSSDSDDTATDTATSAAPMESETMATEEAGTIVDVAAGNPDFETLVAAITAADLGDTLSSEGPYTVFAPTNEAFEALPEGLLDALLLEENVDVLTEILTYHVVSGEVPSSAVEEGDVDTVQGEVLQVTIPDGVVTLNGEATVAAVDVEASNGVIHVIDAVLVPPSVDPSTLL